MPQTFGSHVVLERPLGMLAVSSPTEHSDPSLSWPLAEPAFSAEYFSQNIVPRAESLMMRPLGANSVGSVTVASAGSSPADCAPGENAIAAAGSSLMADAIRA